MVSSLNRTIACTALKRSSTRTGYTSTDVTSSPGHPMPSVATRPSSGDEPLCGILELSLKKARPPRTQRQTRADGLVMDMRAHDISKSESNYDYMAGGLEGEME